MLDVSDAVQRHNHSKTLEHTTPESFDGVLGSGPNDARVAHARKTIWKRVCWGLEPAPELLVVALGYFVQGVKTRMAVMAEKYLMKDILHMSPAKTEVWLEFGYAPWMVKPVFGFISDAAPILGERRRPYLVICGLLSAVAYFCLGAVPGGPWVAAGFIVVGEACIAFSDVVIDGIVVERSRAAPQEVSGALQSVCWGSQAVGSLASAWTGGWLIGKMGPQAVLMLMAVFPLLISCTGLLVKEDRGAPAAPGEAGDDQEAQGLVDGTQSRAAAPTVGVKNQLRTLLGTFSTAAMMLPAIFCFVWSASPNFTTTMFFFYTNALQFSAEFVGRIELLDGIAQLLGVLVFNLYLRSVPLRKIFLWTCLACTAAGFTQLLLVTGANRSLGIPDKVFAAVDSVLVDALNRVALMPVLVLAARICPVSVEATLYASLMAINNAGSGAGRLQGALFTTLFGISASQFGGMPWLVLTCSVLRLVPLACLRLLPRSSSDAALQGQRASVPQP